jgi:serine/threonine protein kinase
MIQKETQKEKLGHSKCSYISLHPNYILGFSGYMALDYASEGLFSIKSDVFSFGILTLEIVRGKNNFKCPSIWRVHQLS